jgi:hypothetical protein
MWTAWRLFLSHPNAHHSIKVARVLVRVDHVASVIVNANHGMMWCTIAGQMAEHRKLEVKCRVII